MYHLKYFTEYGKRKFYLEKQKRHIEIHKKVLMLHHTHFSTLVAVNLQMGEQVFHPYHCPEVVGINQCGQCLFVCMKGNNNNYRCMKVIRGGLRLVRGKDLLFLLLLTFFE